nr:MAG TPA: hypothetical protein [Caudoviricetes sp.]
MRDDVQDSLALTCIFVLLVTLLVALTPAWFLEATEALLIL